MFLLQLGQLLLEHQMLFVLALAVDLVLFHICLLAIELLLQLLHLSIEFDRNLFNFLFTSNLLPPSEEHASDPGVGELLELGNDLLLHLLAQVHLESMAYEVVVDSSRLGIALHLCESVLHLLMVRALQAAENTLKLTFKLNHHL